MNEKSKTKFSDVIGSLVASVANGRNVADVEALRIAHRYHKNELLKGLPIPRLRLYRVSISLPLILSEVIPGTPADRNDPAEIAGVAVEVLEEEIKNVTQRLKDLENQESITDEQKKSAGRYKRFLNTATKMEVRKLFRDEFSGQLKRAFLDMKLSEGDNAPSDASIRNTAAETAENAFRQVMSEVYYLYAQERVAEKKAVSKAVEPFDPDRARKSAKEIMEEDYTKQLIHAIRSAADGAAITKPTVPPDFHVAVDTESIKNAGGGPDAVTRLNMVLLEEGLEWLTEVRDGKETTKLMPE